MEYNILHMMSLGIDTGAEMSSEVLHHSHGHSWCYLLDFFLKRSLQLNRITWMMFVYFSIQITSKEEISWRKIGRPCGPRNITVVRDDVPRKELPQVMHCSLCGVRSSHILLEPNVHNISSKLVQQWLQEIFQHFNVTSRCNGYCRPHLWKSKAPKHLILLQHTKP